MRSRTDIENDHKSFEALNLEVLLDIRDLLGNEKLNNEKLNREPVPTTGKLACPECGKLCKSPLGLASHRRQHK